VSESQHPRRAPRTTYRLQLSAASTLDDAADCVEYLQRLGVDWVYLSPILQSQRGSSHGYDTTDPQRVDADRGGADGLSRLSRRLHERGMGLLVDIVPNHLGVGVPEENPWWWDVLLRGRHSSWADAFDVDWEMGEGRVVLPVLDPEHPDALPHLPDGGHYRLTPWMHADETVNYRRFFGVDSLAAVREEVPRVFEAMHRAVADWFLAGIVDGLRIDHPDGLADPGGYLARLRELTQAGYVVVEKILERGERLPPWDCEGTTGYDALAAVDRLFVDDAGARRLASAGAGGDSSAWEELVLEGKLVAAGTVLRQEARRVAREATGEDDADATEAVATLAACLPVYRTYLPYGSAELEGAVVDASRLRPELAHALDALRPALRDPGHPAARRFQQLSGAVMAKGVEDRAFYRFGGLTSLAEVGGEPSWLSMGPAEFRDAAVARAEQHPATMSVLSTHDTKRSEDVRARLAVLSEMPEEWERWLGFVRERVPTGDEAFDDVLWQGILGAWPLDRERALGFALKAAREAGVMTSWTRPDADVEHRIQRVVDSAFDDAEVRDELERLASRLRRHGWSNSLSAKLVQLSMPGVPDVYQGSELWSHALVDPDNRREVDFAVRARMLDSALAAPPPVDESGAVKLRLTALALALRRDRPELFESYELLSARGPAAEHLFAVRHGGAITLATRLPVGLERGGGWGETEVELPDEAWHDVLADREVRGGPSRVRDLLDRYPVALLVPETVRS